MISDGTEQDAVAILKLILERGPLCSRAVAEALFGAGGVRTTERSNSMSHLRTMKQLGLVRADQVPVQPVGSAAVQNEYTVTPLGRSFMGLHDQAVGEAVPDAEPSPDDFAESLALLSPSSRWEVAREWERRAEAAGVDRARVEREARGSVDYTCTLRTQVLEAEREATPD